MTAIAPRTEQSISVHNPATGTLAGSVPVDGPEQVAAKAGPGDVIVTMGAGDVTLLGREILTALEVKAHRAAPGRPTP